MNTNEAFNILNIQETEADQKAIKTAYKAASLKFHPDRNPAGADMMKIVNAAYNFLKDLGGLVCAQTGFDADHNYGEELNNILNKVSNLEGVEIEICGSWIWLSGNTKPYSAILGRKEGGMGFFYAGKKKMWYYRPEEYKSRNRKGWSMDQIRSTYGSETHKGGKQAKIAA